MDFVSAFLNVLAIIAIIAVGAFLIIFISDLVISIVDGKGSMFFRKRQKGESDARQIEQQEVETLTNKEEVKQIEAPKEEDKTEQQYKIDYEAAAKEEEMFLRKRNDVDYFKPVAELQAQEDEDSKYDEYIKTINQKALKAVDEPEIINLDTKKKEDQYNYFNFDNEGENKQIANKENEEVTKEEYQTLLNEIEEMKKLIAQKSENEEMKEVVEKEVVAPVIAQPIIEEKPAPVAEPQKVEIVKEVDPTKTEEYQKLLNEIAEMKKQMEDAKQKSISAEQELAELKKAKEEAKLIKKEADAPVETVEELEERLAILEDRLALNKKDLKNNKKEFIPLKRIKTNLEKDEEKLRRKEAIVAKQKIMLFGVNNYVYDEEKEKKLAEELDLLDGLRLSVQHCEEVMNSNKDRYPILEKTYNILTRTNEQLVADIEDIKNKLKQLKGE